MKSIFSTFNIYEYYDSNSRLEITNKLLDAFVEKFFLIIKKKINKIIEKSKKERKRRYMYAYKPLRFSKQFEKLDARL